MTKGGGRRSVRRGLIRLGATVGMPLAAGITGCSVEAPPNVDLEEGAAAVAPAPTTEWISALAQGYFEVIGTNDAGDRLVLTCPTPDASPTPGGGIFVDLPDGGDAVPAELVFSEPRPITLAGTSTHPTDGLRTYTWNAPVASDFRRLLLDLEGSDGGLILDVPTLNVRRAFTLAGSAPLWRQQREACRL